MSSHRYAVLDAAGTVLNTILVGDPFPADYFPGYGAYLLGADGSVPAVEGRPDILTLAVSQPVSQGDTVDLTTGEVTHPTPPLPSADELRVYAIARRWEVETGGITVNGLPVPTDDRAKLLLLGAAMTLADDASSPLIINGVTYATLTGLQFKALNAAVVAHVQATFPKLKTVIEGIESGTVTTYAGVDQGFAA